MRCLFAVVVASLTVISPAHAAEVILVHPPAADAFIEEIFHRVVGELRVNAISIKEEQGMLGQASQPMAGELLQRTHADACIFFSWSGSTSVVRIWVSDGTGPHPALLEAAALERTPEVPTMLAARAVDLLTAALKPKPAPPLTIAPRAPDSTTASSPSLKPLPDGPWFAEAGALAFGALSTWGAAWGPQIGLGRAVSPRLRLGLSIAGPLLGAKFANVEASARLVQGIGLVRAEAMVAQLSPLTLSLVGGGGAYFIRATGAIAEGVSSIAADRDSRALVAAAVGANGALSLASHVALVLGAHALFLLPPARVAVGRQSVRVGEPSVTAALTLRLAF